MRDRINFLRGEIYENFVILLSFDLKNRNEVLPFDLNDRIIFFSVIVTMSVTLKSFKNFVEKNVFRHVCVIQFKQHILVTSTFLVILILHIFT